MRGAAQKFSFPRVQFINRKHLAKNHCTFEFPLFDKEVLFGRRFYLQKSQSAKADCRVKAEPSAVTHIPSRSTLTLVNPPSVVTHYFLFERAQQTSLPLL